ncbi:hypothetical protein P4159_23200 [Bacillus thuringiensis]|uniref:hypothetical protein n=1 Tax=Bacillus thuringiensis TaxID=1428 RepID=UPI000CD7ED4C|nr:hypothetical protein [Bacillus thuringiensis]MEC3596997.1 hypothetical protein [Bacillus thuringiensis]MED1833355.1 hypothetical protein [Bacillus thuringiensis]MED2670296.1 hypothetical protein [Bacillus thuringiensis]MED2715975.1 hypothetical protein [Bacillus thuringiensis]
MVKANYVTVGRKPKDGKNPKIQEAFRLPKETVEKINDLVSSGQFSKKVEVAEKAFEFYFAHLEKEK